MGKSSSNRHDIAGQRRLSGVQRSPNRRGDYICSENIVEKAALARWAKGVVGYDRRVRYGYGCSP
jgi:hypothetical protein